MCLSGIHFSLLCSRSGFWAHEDEEQRGAVQVTRVLRRCSEGGGVGCPRPRAAQCRGEAKTSRLGPGSMRMALAERRSIPGMV